jgi:hypothetical protein
MDSRVSMENLWMAASTTINSVVIEALDIFFRSFLQIDFISFNFKGVLRKDFVVLLIFHKTREETDGLS